MIGEKYVIWTAIDVEEELKSVKENVKKIEELIQFNESNLTLPLMFH